MNGTTGPVEITGFATLLVLILSSLVIPAWLRHRKSSSRAEKESVASWEGLTNKLQEERDTLQVRLDKSDTQREKRIRDVVESFQAQIRDIVEANAAEIRDLKTQNAAQQSQITALRAELRQLYEEKGRRT